MTSRIKFEELKATFINAAQGPADSMLTFYHGKGQNAETHMDSLRILSELVPTTDIVIIDGPVRYLPPPGKQDENRRSWINVKTPSQLAGLILKLAFDKVAVFRDAQRFEENELKKRNLSKDRLFRVGFSEGGGTVILTSLNDREECGGVISVSGMTCPYPDKYTNSKPDVLLIMGDQDYFYDFSNPMDPSQKGMPKTDSLLFRITGLDRILGLRHDQTVSRLESKGIPVQQMIVPGMGHKISGKALKAVADFVNAKIKISPGEMRP